MKERLKTWLPWLAVPPVLIGLFVVGLFIYVNATSLGDDDSVRNAAVGLHRHLCARCRVSFDIRRCHAR